MFQLPRCLVASLGLSLVLPLCAQEQSSAGESRREPAAKSRGSENAARGAARSGNGVAGERGRSERRDGEREIDPAVVEQLVRMIDADHDGTMSPAEVARFHAAVERVMQRAKEEHARAEERRDGREDRREDRRDDRHDGREDRREDRRDDRRDDRREERRDGQRVEPKPRPEPRQRNDR